MNRNDVEEFYESLIRTHDFDSLDVNEVFEVTYLRGLNGDTKDKLSEQKKDPQNNKLLITLSHKIMEDASVLNYRLIPANAQRNSNMSHLISTIYDTAKSNSIDRKVGVVDALCHLFGIPMQTVEPQQQSSASFFLDLANKVVGYVAVFSSKKATLVTAINLVLGLARYTTGAEDHASSVRDVDMIFYTVISTICINYKTGYEQGLYINIMGLVCKGLCISLSHYLASWPLLANSAVATGHRSDAATHFITNCYSTLPFESGSGGSISESSLHHGAIFLFSIIWPLITYMTYFDLDGKHAKTMLMLWYLFVTEGAVMSHKIPRGGPVGAFSLITGSRPDVLHYPFSIIYNKAPPAAIHNAIENQHGAELAMLKARGFPNAPRPNAIISISNGAGVKVIDAEMYALAFLDIMRTYLRTWRRPVIMDAFDILKPEGDDDIMWSAAAVMNSWSVAPCISSFRPMSGFNMKEMRIIANKIVSVEFANKKVFNHNGGNDDVIQHAVNFDHIMQLLEPTIEGFLYAYQTRNYSPSSIEMGCLGLKKYDRGGHSGTIISFQNHMDKYFFKILKTELGLTYASDRFQGVRGFYEYK